MVLVSMQLLLQEFDTGHCPVVEPPTKTTSTLSCWEKRKGGGGQWGEDKKERCRKRIENTEEEKWGEDEK